MSRHQSGFSTLSPNRLRYWQESLAETATLVPENCSLGFTICVSTSHLHWSPHRPHYSQCSTNNKAFPLLSLWLHCTYNLCGWIQFLVKELWFWSYWIPEGKSAVSWGVLSSTGWTLLASVNWDIKPVVPPYRKTISRVQKSICFMCHFLCLEQAPSRSWSLTSQPCCAITVALVDVRETVDESVWNHSGGLFKYGSATSAPCSQFRKITNLPFLAHLPAGTKWACVTRHGRERDLLYTE